MKIKTSRDTLLDLIPETEAEKLLLGILAKRDVRIASSGYMDRQCINLCLEFNEHIDNVNKKTKRRN